MGRFGVQEKLKNGSFGSVYSTYDRVLRADVAIKVRILDDVDEEEGVPQDMLREIKALRELGGHSSILPILDVECGSRRLPVLVLELMSCSVSEYLKKNKGPLQGEEASRIMSDVAEGVAHMHHLEYMHRDIKPQNLLIGKGGRAAVADFGLAFKIIPGRRHTLPVQTLWYRAPEVLLGDDKYDESVDVWSLGAVHMELLLNQICCPGDCDFGQIMKTFQLCGTPNEMCWPGVTLMPDYCAEWPKMRPNGTLTGKPSCIQSALSLDPRARISARQYASCVRSTDACRRRIPSSPSGKGEEAPVLENFKEAAKLMNIDPRCANEAVSLMQGMQDSASAACYLWMGSKIVEQYPPSVSEFARYSEIGEDTLRSEEMRVVSGSLCKTLSLPSSSCKRESALSATSHSRKALRKF